MRVDAANRAVAVEGAPGLPAAGSRWQIPAGLSGVTPRLEYNLTPPAGGGWDHYDALLLVVHKGAVQQIYRFSSYTSRRQAGQNLSSVRGNRRYAYSSFRSGGGGGQFRNFSLKIADAQRTTNGLSDTHVADTIAEARFYFATQVPAAGGDPIPDVTRDANGKQLVRYHRGNRVAGGSGSAGCCVSPDYVLMRTLLVKLYEADFREFYGVPQAKVDDQVTKLNPSAGAVARQDLNDGTIDRAHADVTRSQTGVDAQNAASDALYAAAQPPPAANPGLAGADWDEKLRGITWIVRPDEPPIS
jgi:hypothetical protein